jgi:hypothetical protein
MTYTCPVCGYNRLDEQPCSWSICPSCRTVFDYSDSGRMHAILRAAWIADGARWRSKALPQPSDWNPITQLRNIGYHATADDWAQIDMRFSVVNVTVSMGASEAVLPIRPSPSTLAARGSVTPGYHDSDPAMIGGTVSSNDIVGFDRNFKQRLDAWFAYA